MGVCRCTYEFVRDEGKEEIKRGIVGSDILFGTLNKKIVQRVDREGDLSFEPLCS